MAAVSNDKHGASKKHEPHYELPTAEALKEAGELMLKGTSQSLLSRRR